ncbi:phage replisome organizer N-terminal domain-containing protein [Faecalicoccus pleomorphus]|uniref:phage replisome organizer N-terminal domain-containing protein n=1 Tax=Faecalicoccus pleomorphus TaxID=1323 RepID=UPI0022E1DE80|nr:phage replisome organizer N-terminal domain-containing protein [Faecalicoccus pleomorphus]
MVKKTTEFAADYKVVGNKFFFPTTFFDDPRIKAIEQLPGSHIIIYLWIRLIGFDPRIIIHNNEGYTLIAGNGTRLDQKQLATHTKLSVPTLTYALSVLEHYGAYPFQS